MARLTVPFQVIINMEIADWRVKIDELDRRLVELISERARCAVEIGKLNAWRDGYHAGAKAISREEG